MNNQEAIEMLTAKAECIRREASGIDVDCNHRNCDECDLCYKQGTMGDQMEALGVAISALQEQEAKNSNESSLTQKGLDTISRRKAINTVKKHYRVDNDLLEVIVYQLENLPPAQPEWNNHTVACLLAELFDDTCACNYNGIDEWLPSKCELLDSCPNPAGVACWEQYLTHRAERRTDE